MFIKLDKYKYICKILRSQVKICNFLHICYNYLIYKEIILMINERFKQIRKALGFSQTEFAEQLNKKLRMIQYYETNNYNITLDVLLLLQEKFNVNTDWLINGNGSMFLSDNEKKADSGVVSIASSYNVPERLLILLSKLKKEDLIRVEGYIQAIVDSYKNKDMQKLSS